MAVEYSSHAVQSMVEELLEIGMGYNSRAASMLKDYAALLAKTEVACDNCEGLGMIRVAHGNTPDSHWPCPHCNSGVVQGDPLQWFVHLQAMWEKDAKEYLNKWGQHMPGSVEVFAEQMALAIKRTRIGQLRGKYKGSFSTVEEFLQARKEDAGE